MIILILILLSIINLIYICFKYYKSNKIISDDARNMDSIIIGYINDKGVGNSFDLILSEIIELNIKEYITIIYGKNLLDRYNFTIKQNIPIGDNRLNPYEMFVLNYLFPNKMEITKIELEERLRTTYHSYNVQFNELRNLLDKKLEEENIIDKDKQEIFYKKTKRYILLSSTLVLLISVLGLCGIIGISLLHIYIILNILSSILLLKVDLYTNTGKSLKYSISNYKSELKAKEFLTYNSQMQEIVINKDFANSVALHINTQAKKAFIDDKISKESRKISKRQLINFFIILIITVLLSIIISKIPMILPKNLVFWFYLLTILVIACILDIIHLLNEKK